MYRHFFWCAFGKISIAAVALLAQCTKHSVTCRNSRKYALWRHIWLHLKHAGVHICSSTMRRRPLEAGRKAKKPLKAASNSKK